MEKYGNISTQRTPDLDGVLGGQKAASADDAPAICRLDNDLTKQLADSVSNVFATHVRAKDSAKAAD